jgi:hypothetical protein
LRISVPNSKAANQGCLIVEKNIERGGRIIEVNTVQHLSAGALGLDVAGLLALVADLLATAGVLGAVTGEVTGLAAVVALGAVDTVA